MADLGHGLSRREFLGAAATTLGAVAIGGSPAAAGGPGARAAGYDHVVVVMMENRSFDHLLGWVPRADGRQAGLTYADAAGQLHATHPLAPDFQGCGHPNPDHSYAGGRVEYDDGRADGWLRAGDNDDYAIGYYGQADLPFLGQAVPQWTTFDRYFAATLGPTFPNRLYQHAGQTDRFSNTLAISTLPTIWDRLADAGLTGRYYFSDIPFTALWGAKHLSISRSVLSFFGDCAAGTLPNVAFVDPFFLGEDLGVSNDDHPHADLRKGEVFMNRIYRAVTRSPAWERTVLIYNFDEWGGFFDHVAPSPAPIPAADAAAGATDGLRGFRVPCLMVSPLARRRHVAHGLYDHTSILRMIERRWGLEPLTVRDATANDLGSELGGWADRRAPRYDVPNGPFGGACAPAAAAVAGTTGAVAARAGGHAGADAGARGHARTRTRGAAWTGLRSLARRTGWRV